METKNKKKEKDIPKEKQSKEARANKKEKDVFQTKKYKED